QAAVLSKPPSPPSARDKATLKRRRIFALLMSPVRHIRQGSCYKSEISRQATVRSPRGNHFDPEGTYDAYPPVIDDAQNQARLRHHNDVCLAPDRGSARRSRLSIRRWAVGRTAPRTSCPDCTSVRPGGSTHHRSGRFAAASEIGDRTRVAERGATQFGASGRS